MKSKDSNGWKAIGWLMVLILICILVFGVYAITKSKSSINRDMQIDMQELDIQVELNTPADIPITTASQDQIDSLIQGRATCEIVKKDSFISLLKAEINGRMLVAEDVVRKGNDYCLRKSYYFFPKQRLIVFLYTDIYYFRKVSKWRRSRFVTMAPHYVTYTNLKLETRTEGGDK